MPHEIIGELIVFGIEAGLEVASEDKKGGWCGCLFVIFCIIGGIAAYYYFG
jgi:hypothetical protein